VALQKELQMRVLVIEDDEELAATVATGLRQAQMAVDVALDGEAGLTRALVNDYDVIVLDRDLPVLHGDDVCARLVDAGGRSRILMLTGATASDELVDGLGRHQAHEPVRARLDLDDRGDAVLLDPGDNAGEPVPSRLRDDRASAGGPSTLSEQTRHFLEWHEPLTALRPAQDQPAVALPPAKRLDRHAEHLGRLSGAQKGGVIFAHTTE
jgi:CheY-like chemotaxis protein